MNAQALLQPGGAALVVIDIQDKLVKMLPEATSQRVIHTVSKLVPLMERLEVPILWTEQYPAGLGATIPEVAALLESRPRFEKTVFSCFGAPGFGGWLWERGISRLLITGIETHICVLQTALQGLQAGLNVHVLADGVGCYKAEDHDRALARIQAAGGVVSSWEIAVYELLGRAEGPAFKACLPYLRDRD
jgi:nicotinamidase-related amidase